MGSSMLLQSPAVLLGAAFLNVTLFSTHLSKNILQLLKGGASPAPCTFNSACPAPHLANTLSTKPRRGKRIRDDYKVTPTGIGCPMLIYSTCAIAVGSLDLGTGCHPPRQSKQITWTRIVFGPLRDHIAKGELKLPLIILAWLRTIHSKVQKI
eukprot:TRINITY_DN15419_c1_g1_i1.p1 TRINITY_DN15419_c1_g1~~TRINITY_DN15419_c1_g1_i1.p1  ORF type:complete len:153 (+),score=7.30 TRINITY_DN15419_c1_g1_i1:189-647(+)